MMFQRRERFLPFYVIINFRKVKNMISQETYITLLNEFGFSSSWTAWSAPANGNWKSKDSVSDMSLFTDADKITTVLNGNYIFAGLNPSVHDIAAYQVVAWDNFHSSDTKRSQDYKLRYALRGTKYWGSFITDVYSGIAEVNSNAAMRKVTESKTNESVEKILCIREILGGTATIVAIGNKAFSVLKKNLPSDIELKKITHYSSYVNIEKYRDMVLQQLGEEIDDRPEKTKNTFEIDDIKRLYEAFVKLCNYTEKEIGCENCPMHLKNCGMRGMASADVFEKAMARIREKACISDL